MGGEIEITESEVGDEFTLTCHECGATRWRLVEAGGVYCHDCGAERGELLWTDVVTLEPGGAA